MQSPLKHHFLPVFYLKQWAIEAKGRVVEFSKPYKDVVKPRRVHPDGTGYISRLYAIDGMHDEIACEMERDFLSPVDSKAAAALNSLKNGEALSEAQREAWSMFIASLICRMPEDVRLIKQMLADLARDTAPSLRRLYDASRPADRPSEFDELTESFVASAPSRAMKRLRAMMSHGTLLHGFSAMHWEVISLCGQRQLLTSDRPVTYTNVLRHAESHLVLPIGPHKLFVAAHEIAYIKKLRRLPADRLIADANRCVVEQADKYVYGTNDGQLRFVQNRMGHGKTPQLMARLVELQRERLPDMLAAFSSVPLEIKNPIKD